MPQSSASITKMRNRFNQTRLRYKPYLIRTLLVAEAPPETKGRFFYFEDVPTQDSLFLETMSVLYPDLKDEYIRSRRSPKLKKAMLEKFKEDGFWLLDLSELPKSMLNSPVENCLDELLINIEKYSQTGSRIILIKANVFDCCYRALRIKGYNISSERIPFPGSGQQKNFRTKFAKALKE